MEGMHGTSSWQEVLRRITRDPLERQRIANEAEVQPITLLRWISRKSKPRDENMRLLLKAIPRDYYQEFARLIAPEYPAFFQEDTTTVSIAPAPPLEFYMQVLSAHANTPPSLYPQALYDLLLQQMIHHLDPDRRGMLINVMRCMPPIRGSKVRSLRRVSSVGTPPWEKDQDQTTMFLGAESLAGAAVTYCRQVMVPSRDEEYNLYPVHWIEHEQSTAAYPLMCKTRVAGCLIVSSALPRTFSRAHLTLIERYAHLVALACEPGAFFDLDDIELRLMPPYTIQAQHLRYFGQRVAQTFAKTSGHQLSTLQEAQELVWQEVEEELLQIMSYTNL